MEHHSKFRITRSVLTLSCLFCLTVFINPVKAQLNNSFFRNIGPEDGLSHAKVNCIMQDKRGFLWFGTEDGLNRYDGHYFTMYRSQPNDTTCISGNIITDLYEDKRGIIWIATADGGITRYNYHLPASKQFKQYKYNPRHPNGIPQDRVNNITEDQLGNLWLATNNSFLVRFNKRTERFDSPLKLLAANVLATTMADQDTLWVARENGGLLKINTRTLQYKVDHHAGSNGLTSRHKTITSIYKDGHNNLWFSTIDKSLYRYNQGTREETKIDLNKSGIPMGEDQILSFAEDKRHSIWMGGKTMGLLVYDKNTRKFTKYQHDRYKDGTLADNHVNTVFVDREGIVWIGTDNGLSVHDPVYSPFKQYELPKKDKDITINDFYKDEHGKLYIATSAGIFIKSPGSEHLDHKEITYNGQKLEVTKFFVDKNKKFYLGTDYTLFTYDPRHNRIATLPNTASDGLMSRLFASRIVSIVPDTIANHPVLIVSPYGQYLTYYDLKDQRWVSHVGTSNKILEQFNLRDSQIKKFYKDTKGGIWLATNRYGLGNWQQNDQPIKYFSNLRGNDTSLSNNDVYDILGDKRGNLWISTYGGGLNYFNTQMKKFLHISESSNLTEGMEMDHKGNVWMICNGHMHEYNPLTKVYSCYDLPNLKKNGGIKGYIYKDSDGTLYAGGLNFYVAFNPGIVKKIKHDPDVYFTDFKIFNTSYPDLLEQRAISLTYDQNYFSISFSAPEYSSNHVHYDYMLQGFDKNWVTGNQHNIASYSNLPGGTYQFKVRASNWKGTLVSKYSMLTIVILPPFWQRWWFFLSITVLVLAICYLLYRYRINEYIKRQRIRNGIAQDLHDQIGSTLSSISIYSQVAKIYQGQQKDEMLTQVLDTIGETANETISEMSDIVWAINPKNDHVSSIIQKIQSYSQPLCVAKHINFILKCDEKASKLRLEMTERKNFYLILKESINNAIKHSECKNLQVNIRQVNYSLELLIKDDGKGFDPDLKHDEVAEGSSGNGVNNIKSRADELNATLRIDSNPLKGTIINLTFSIL